MMAARWVLFVALAAFASDAVAQTRSQLFAHGEPAAQAHEAAVQHWLSAEQTLDSLRQQARDGLAVDRDFAKALSAAVLAQRWVLVWNIVRADQLLGRIADVEACLQRREKLADARIAALMKPLLDGRAEILERMSPALHVAVTRARTGGRRTGGDVRAALDVVRTFRRLKLASGQLPKSAVLTRYRRAVELLRQASHDATFDLAVGVTNGLYTYELTR